MFNINVESSEELIRELELFDISVPNRSKGRKTEHTEKWAIIHFLATYLNENKLRFPLKTIHRDKPDFYLKSGESEIGIECTEAIPKQYAWAAALWEQYFQPGFFDLNLFRWNSPVRSRKEIMDILSKSQKQLIGVELSDRNINQEWAKWIQGCIEVKKRKFNKVEFEKFENNYLLIYDNLPVVINNLESATNILSDELRYFWSIQTELFFTEIIIVSGRIIVRITPTKKVPYQIPPIPIEK